MVSTSIALPVIPPMGSVAVQMVTNVRGNCKVYEELSGFCKACALRWSGENAMMDFVNSAIDPIVRPS